MPFSRKCIVCSKKDVRLVFYALPVLNPCGISPNYLSFPSFDCSFLKNCSQVLLLLSLEERVFSCSANYFSSLNIDMTFIIINQDIVLVLIDYLSLLPHVEFPMPVLSLVWVEMT